mmetsp:Transcript_15601/g.32280  ORF Transcript_15601/g.32280 Transcript_15601/m.32280 type:complete len:83 (-) Transcript_15601:847-1095(-)
MCDSQEYGYFHRKKDYGATRLEVPWLPFPTPAGGGGGRGRGLRVEAVILREAVSTPYSNIPTTVKQPPKIAMSEVRYSYQGR